MTSLAEILRPLDPGNSLPLYQQLQRALREAIEKRILAPTTRCRPSASSPPTSAISRITVRKAIDGLVEEGLLVRRQGSGNFVCRAHREELRQAHLVLRGHARARAHAAAASGCSAAEGTVTPEEALDAAACAPARPSTASTACATPTTRRWRSSTRPSSPRLPAVARRGRRVALRGAARRPATARCARCSGCARCCSTPSRPKLLHARDGRCRPAGRARGLPARRPRGRVLASPITAATPTTSSPS